MLEDATVKPLFTLTANDKWIEFSLRNVVDFKTPRFPRGQAFNRILDKFEKTDGKIKFASTSLQLVETPVIAVNLPNTKGK